MPLLPTVRHRYARLVRLIYPPDQHTKPSSPSVSSGAERTRSCSQYALDGGYQSRSSIRTIHPAFCRQLPLLEFSSNCCMLMSVACRTWYSERRNMNPDKQRKLCSAACTVRPLTPTTVTAVCVPCLSVACRIERADHISFLAVEQHQAHIYEVHLFIKTSKTFILET